MRVRFVSALLVWHGVTPAELGQVLGNTRGTIYKKLQGERAFTTRDLETISELFDIDPGLLLRPQSAAAVLGAVRESATDLLTCTFKLLPQVRGCGQPLYGIAAKRVLLPAVQAA